MRSKEPLLPSEVSFRPERGYGFKFFLGGFRVGFALRPSEYQYVDQRRNAETCHDLCRRHCYHGSAYQIPGQSMTIGECGRDTRDHDRCHQARKSARSSIRRKFRRAREIADAVVIDNVEGMPRQESAKLRKRQQAKQYRWRGKHDPYAHPDQAYRGSKSKPEIQISNLIVREACESLRFDPPPLCT